MLFVACFDSWSYVRFSNDDRLAGAALLGPVANYWWPGFPANVSKAAWDEQLVPDQWAVRVAHYAPWLTYWWNTQKLFPGSSVMAQRPHLFSPGDLKVLHKFKSRGHYMVRVLLLSLFVPEIRIYSIFHLFFEPDQGQILQQGEHNSLHRDMMVGFGHWEFDPMDLENPFPNGEGSVHLWHGAEDRIVPVIMSRYLAQKLPWVQYRELPDAGHMFPLADGMADIIVRSLLLGD